MSDLQRLKKIKKVKKKVLTLSSNGAIMVLKKGKEIPKKTIKPQQKGKVNNYGKDIRNIQSRTDD